MPSPPIQLFLTTIASQPALRRRQELLLRVMHVKKITFTSYDLASDENAKKLWRRRAPAEHQQLPGILVGGVFPGPFDKFEEAVEYDELDIFFRLKEDYDPELEGDRPLLAAQTIGVPGVHSEDVMTPERHKIKPTQRDPNAPKPVPVNKKGREEDIDLGDELEGFGLQGVKASKDELSALIAELGLDGAEADELVKGLGGLALDNNKSEDTAKDTEEPVVSTSKPADSKTVDLSTQEQDEEETKKDDAVDTPHDEEKETTPAVEESKTIDSPSETEK